MIYIPNGLWLKYGMILTKKTISVSFHNHYKKWLRYYLDYGSNGGQILTGCPRMQNCEI